MKIALGQLNVVAGGIRQNLNRMKEMVEYAKQRKADLIVFPELCVGGYLLADKWLDQDFLNTLEEANEEIKSWSTSIGIIYGNASTQPHQTIEKGRDGRPIRMNAAFFCYNQRWVKKANDRDAGRHIKHLNPNYRIFDDSRYFLSGLEIALQDHKTAQANIAPFLFEKDGKTWRIGLEVCEDLWSDDYALDVTQEYIHQQVDLLVNISASPWTLNKEASRDRQLKKHALRAEGQFVPLVYVNCCGMQNNGKTIVTFDGDSTLYDAMGNRQISCNDHFEEECRVLTLDDRMNKKINTQKLLDALICAIQQMDRQVFNQRVRWIIGLSGGLDSTINAALLCLALGSERVLGYNMASRYNSLITKNNAKELAQRLNMEIREGSIEKITEASLETLQDYGYSDSYDSLVYENIQARIRGHLLATFASVENGVIINNGNKVEVALGYCTLYGDAIGAFCPIADCTKVQLFELAKQINERFEKEIVPSNLLPRFEKGQLHWEMPPSAELKDAQLDPMKWFYHDWLIEKITEYPTAQIEEVMQAYLDKTIYDQEIGQWIRYYGLDDPKKFIEDLEWVTSTMARNVFKRFQMPPVVMISRGAFGSDYRESQLRCDCSSRYLQLREAILKEADTNGN